MKRSGKLGNDRVAEGQVKRMRIAGTLYAERRQSKPNSATLTQQPPPRDLPGGK
jgi:hypothetical protein